MTGMARRGGRTIRPAVPDDWERIRHLRQTAFNWPGEPSLLVDMWVLEEAGAILACARLEADAQWLGGRPVPTGLVSSVAVAPAARGRGIASDLLRGLLRRARETGLPRLALYPSAVKPYRQAGFEIAGVAVTLSVAAAQLPRHADASVDEMSPDDASAVAGCYDRVARGRNGAIARSQRWWQTRVLPNATPAPGPPSDVHGFVVRDGAAISGYVLYTQAADGDTPYATTIDCRDLVWETPQAALALFGLLGSGHPMTTTVSWPGEAVDPARFVLDEAVHASAIDPWMARLVDPVAALGEHGTSPDEPLPSNKELLSRVTKPLLVHLPSSAEARSLPMVLLLRLSYSLQTNLRDHALSKTGVV